MLMFEMQHIAITGVQTMPPKTSAASISADTYTSVQNVVTRVAKRLLVVKHLYE
jgi:cytochrome c5